MVSKRWEFLETKFLGREKRKDAFFSNVPLFTSVLSLVLKEEET